ncbi:hypothetical protein SeMB42_g02993 [Synchytrium endobioticum]|uniref:Uncharacterized protein n=1 Tax=Synchytrium endobioticum TaxID=286115 RepID=A0A507DAJ2_9FUNG|nr:hypothetical protein SeMB42_g02993 [Synchytrium endobioticum]
MARSLLWIDTTIKPSPSDRKVPRPSRFTNVPDLDSKGYDGRVTASTTNTTIRYKDIQNSGILSPYNHGKLLSNRRTSCKPPGTGFWCIRLSSPLCPPTSIQHAKV